MGVSISDIVGIVADKTGVSEQAIKGRRRQLKQVVPRQMVYLLAREYTAASTPEIGRYMNNRDHTTVLAGVDAIKSRAARCSVVRGQLEACRREIETFNLGALPMFFRHGAFNFVSQRSASLN